MEETYNGLHTALAKGRDCHTRLSKLHKLSASRSASCPALESLGDALDSATTSKEELEQSLEMYYKKDTRRKFKRFVGEKVERGN